MACCCVSRESNSLRKCYNPEDNSDYSCLKCAELESNELSSSQLIIKLLYKEINDITTEKTLKPTNTIPDHVAGGNVASSNTWSQVASKRPHNINKVRISDTYQKTQPIESTNRYAKLANLPDTTICCDGYVTPKSMEAAQTSTNNCMKKEHRRIQHPTFIRHPRNTAEQPSSSHHEVQSKQTSDQNSNCIPTIVNGQINQTKNANNNNSANNNRNYILNLVTESTVKVLHNKAKYSKCSKHKILVMGDSHLRGCTAKMIASLDPRFSVCGIAKPGSNTGSLIQTAKGEVENLTMNDFLIICSGMNDTDMNSSRNAFRNIIDFIKSVNYTNIILISVPNRHDLPIVYNNIKTLNSKLLKLAKILNHVNIIEPANDRLLFPKHRLHLNELGKELPSNQLTLHILSVLEEVKVNANPITLGWYDKNLYVNVPSIDRPSHMLTPTNYQLLSKQAPKRIKTACNKER